eukprot:1257062-Karenia_brevis.AAC.1
MNAELAKNSKEALTKVQQAAPAHAPAPTYSQPSSSQQSSSVARLGRLGWNSEPAILEQNARHVLDQAKVNPASVREVIPV